MLLVRRTLPMLINACVIVGGVALPGMDSKHMELSSNNSCWADVGHCSRGIQDPDVLQLSCLPFHRNVRYARGDGPDLLHL
jgi:hypothetical protein